jgi:16S rRNA (cytidine1402-2'-O)-methyltransferase
MTLYLIPLPIFENEIKFMPVDVIKTLHSLSYFIVEKARTARRFIKSTGFEGKIEELTFIELDKHKPDSIDLSILEPVIGGNDMGLMSEAGMPCIADPGSAIVSMAHEMGIKVVPLSGPSSIFLALAASGLNGQNFHFLGYLPVKNEALMKKMKSIEKSVFSESITNIFIETPYRNHAMMQNLLKILNSELKLCIAANITSDSELISTKKIKDWRKEILPDLNKQNCVFLIGK